jgi:hypothetical protein
MRRNLSWTLLIIFICLITIPYLFAQFSGGEQSVFGGFLLNPQDGNSYLAKMMEGWNGSWQFTLPYTAEKGNGAFLFLFYLSLGQLSRLTGISLILMYHIARLAGAVLLVFSVRDLAMWIFEKNQKDASAALQLSLFGSGLGWLLVGFGVITSDLWVAETYPFLSSFATPHFCFGMVLLLQLFLNFSQPVVPTRLAKLALYGLLLAILMPFGIVVAGAVGLVWIAWEWFKTRQLHWANFVAAFILGGPCLIYQYWAIQSDPLLSAWNAQNLTPSPPVWDLLMALAPAVFFAAWGVWKLFRRSDQTQGMRLMVVWCVTGLAMIYFPFGLQRRFMFDYYLPIAFTAVAGLQEIPRVSTKLRKRIFAFLLTASVVTNLVVIMLAVFGVISRSPLIYLNKDEVNAFDFIRTRLPSDTIILCSPDTGNFIPAWTGRRVLYGHPFETVRAEENKQLVTNVFNGQILSTQAIDLLRQRNVRYVFVGPRERAIGTPDFIASLKQIYQNGTVQIYSW